MRGLDISAHNHVVRRLATYLPFLQVGGKPRWPGGSRGSRTAYFYLVGQYFGSAVFRPQPDITPGVVWVVNEAVPVEVHTPPVEDIILTFNTGSVNLRCNNYFNECYTLYEGD